ncbi:hypothetical protein ACFL17_02520 [Pseudomonadota bacterium]
MFYISSQGHSATGWLSKVLSAHPKIVCWHGTRSIPPHHAGERDMPIDDFVAGLIECEKNTHNQKQFGACHGYHGSIAKSLVESNGGRFLAIVRHPIRRVQSMMSDNLGHFLSFRAINEDTKTDLNFYFSDVFFNTKDIQYANKFNRLFQQLDQTDGRNLSIRHKMLRKIQSAGQNIFRKKAYKIYSRKLQIDQKNDLVSVSHPNPGVLTAQIIMCFDDACKRTMLSDSAIFHSCEENQILKTEEMVSSRSYFDESIFVPITGERADKSYLDHVFNETDHVNRHTVVPKEPLDTFTDWPKVLQDKFLEHLHSSSAVKLYKSFDYDLPS